MTENTGELRVRPKGTGLAPNIASFLCYLCIPFTLLMPVVSIIFIILEKEDKDVQFHAWQATSFNVAFLATMTAIWIVANILGLIIGFLGFIVGLLMPLVGMGCFLIWVICLANAYQGKCWRIPYIGDFAAKRSGLED